MTQGAEAVWAVVPAAGRGERMDDPTPKQYHRLAGRAVLQWSIEAMLEVDAIRGVMVALAPDDRHWHRLAAAGHPRVHTCTGGAQRSASVRAGLQALLDRGAGPTDAVLVHDAARPAVRVTAVKRLLAAAAGEADGGLLALPVRDTLKRDGGDHRVADTIARDGLWQAQTPQLFPLGRLMRALEQADASVTDEASAMEWLGARPRLIEGDVGNIKYTYAGDHPWLTEQLRHRGGDRA
jgi:2-C-methyl-D-erythritol 4-phosphate cytidylyltransferase